MEFGLNRGTAMRLIPILATAAALAAVAGPTPVRAEQYPLGPAAGGRLAVTAPFFYTGYYAATHYPYSRQIVYHQPAAGLYYGEPRRLAKRYAHYAPARPPRQHYVTGYVGNGPYGYTYYNGYNW